MKTDNLNQPGERTHGIVRGHVGRGRASSGVTVRDGTTTADSVVDLTFGGSGFTLIDNDDGTATLVIDDLAGFNQTDADLLYLKRKYGEQHVVSTTTASGAAVTIDCSTANIFDITLTANCTLTITNPPPTNVGGQIVIVLRQGGSGSYTVTWPAAVVWQNPTTGGTGGSPPTLFTAVGAQNVIELSTLDGGVTWGGAHESAGGSFATPAIVLGTAAAAGTAGTTIRSDATIVAFDATAPASVGTSNATGSAAVAARRDHVHDGSTVVGPTDHAHVTGETHLSDGSTTTYTLDQQFEPGSVEAFNTTTLAYLTVTEAQPDQATVSAAGTTGDKITFSYAATVA